MDGFKQRIIGALVLISLAVIFVPMLLDEPHEERTTRSIEIPEEPDFPEVRIEPAEKPALTDTIEPIPAPENPPMQTLSSIPEQVEPAPMNAEEPVRQEGERTESSEPVAGETTAAQTEPEASPAPQPQPQSQSQSQSQPAEASSPQKEPAPERSEATGGFLVQLGSFGSGSNAKRLQGSVQETGYSAFTTEIQSGGKTYTRVFAGPFPEKGAANAAKAKLDSKFGLNTLVVVNDD